MPPEDDKSLEQFRLEVVPGTKARKSDGLQPSLLRGVAPVFSGAVILFSPTGI